MASGTGFTQKRSSLPSTRHLCSGSETPTPLSRHHVSFIETSLRWCGAAPELRSNPYWVGSSQKPAEPAVLSRRRETSPRFVDTSGAGRRSERDLVLCSLARRTAAETSTWLHPCSKHFLLGVCSNSPIEDSDHSFPYSPAPSTFPPEAASSTPSNPLRTWGQALKEELGDMKEEVWPLQLAQGQRCAVPARARANPGL